MELPGIVENIRKHRKTAEDGGGQWGTMGDNRGWCGTVGDNTMSSVLVLAQDGRTAPMRTLLPVMPCRPHQSYLSQERSARKLGHSILYECSDVHRCFAIYIFNLCLWVLVAWDKYVASEPAVLW